MKLYYGFWSMMLPWPVILRAAVVIGVILFFTFILWPLLRKLLSLALIILDYGVKLLYTIGCFIIQLFYHVGLKQSIVKITNAFSDAMSAVSKLILKIAYKLQGKVKRNAKIFLVIYGICIMSIALPDILGNVISPSYYDTISWARKVYLDCEKGTIQKSKSYEPLVKWESKEKRNKKEKNAEVWLQLAGEGISGANIRSGAGKNYSSIAVVSGDEKLLYLGEENGWIHVQTEGGIEGWISRNIVKGVPE